MKTITIGAIGALLFASAHADQGAFIAGNKLYSYMTSESPTDRAHALGYVVGVADAFDDYVFCTPAGVTAKQMNDIARDFIAGRPDVRHQSGAALVAVALSKAFPCADKPAARPGAM